MSNNRSRLIMKQFHIRPAQQKFNQETLQAIQESLDILDDPTVETFSSVAEMEKKIFDENF